MTIIAFGLISGIIDFSIERDNNLPIILFSPPLEIKNLLTKINYLNDIYHNKISTTHEIYNIKAHQNLYILMCL
ncbi:MAG: hypothetical protein QG591_657 [Planctomycetota bacterium]|nr:hypothetical protein [Planctomycetota bacterium]